MVNSIGSAPSSSLIADLAVPKTKSADTADSFAQQLAAALEGYLSQAGDGSHLEIDVEAKPGQDSGARQFIVTVKTLTGPAPAPAQAATPGVNLMGLTRPPMEATPVRAPAAQATPRPILNEADAYWASQPPEIQALRDLPEESQRYDLAQQLAAKGFSIDVPLMVWNWDPLTTMMVRQNSGFTWVPSMNQPPVQVAPGLRFGNLPSYDAGHPPPGSIKVTTDFAKGLEWTDPWLHTFTPDPVY